MFLTKRELRNLNRFLCGILCLLASCIPSDFVSAGSEGIISCLARDYERMNIRGKGSVRFIVQNRGTEDAPIQWVKINDCRIRRPSDMGYDDAETSEKREWKPYPAVSGPGQPLWAWVSRETLQPGQAAECIVRFASMPKGPVDVELGFGDRSLLKTTVPLEPPAVRISDINFNKARTDVYAYVENRGHAPIHMESAQLLNLGINATVPTAALLPGRKRCVHFRLQKPVRFGERVYVLVRLKHGESAGLSALAFGTFPINVGRATELGLKEDMDGINGKMILKDYTEFHFWQDVVAYRVMDVLEKMQPFREGILPFAIVNQGFIKDAVITLGEIVPCFYLACEPLEAEYLGRYNEKDFHYLQAKTRYIKEALSPNLPWLGLRTFHGYSEFKKEVQPIEMRLRLYYLVTRGAKGLFYRYGYWEECPKQWQQDMKAEINAVHQELLLMRDLLRIAEPVDDIAKTSEPLVEAATLLGGDKGIVLVLLNHDRSFAWPAQEKDNKEPFWIAEKPDPITVAAEIPEGVQVKEVFEIGGAWTTPGFTQQGNQISFTVDKLHAARPFLISFVSEANREGLLANANEDYDSSIMLSEPKPLPAEEVPPSPDIQFEKKQHFFKPIDPAEETIQCKFPFRNVGKASLHISTKEAEPRVNVAVEAVDLGPGEASVITVRVSPKDLGVGKFKKRVKLTTNDPNEPEVTLLLGGVIQPEITFFPQRVVLSASEATARISIRDHREGILQIEGVESPFPEITCDSRQTERIKTISHAEVFRGDVLERAYHINVEAPVAFLRKGHRLETLLIKTNAPHHRKVEIPVEISPDRKCVVTPSSLFFGKIEKNSSAVRSCKIASGGTLSIRGVSSTDDFAQAEVSATQAGHEYLLEATLTPNAESLQKGHIVVEITLDGNEQTIQIPYLALVR